MNDEERRRFYPRRLESPRYQVGLRREDRALYERVEAAIRDLVASGEIERIRKRWESPPAGSD